MEEENNDWVLYKDLITPDLIHYMSELGQLREDYEKSTTYLQRLKAVKDYYLRNEDKIIAHCKKTNRGLYSAYPIDWIKLFTPIESDAWNVIRCRGMALYPQYPALNYHIDFANPLYKLGLEIDGKQYHDKAKDEKRDAKLKEAGWIIYRITGSEMANTRFKSLSECQEEYLDADETYDEIRKWIIHTGDGVITALFYTYFRDFPYWGFRDDMISLFEETLNIHCSTKNPWARF